MGLSVGSFVRGVMLVVFVNGQLSGFVSEGVMIEWVCEWMGGFVRVVL